MKIQFNDKLEEIESGVTVREFLDRRALTGSNLILEWNGEILPLKDAEASILNDGDTLNAFSLVGGG